MKKQNLAGVEFNEDRMIDETSKYGTVEGMHASTGPAKLNLGDVKFDTFYQLFLNGKPINRPTTSKAIIENELSQLPPEQASLVEIVTVTASGQRILHS